MNVLGSIRCPYGTRNVEYGPTPRAKSHSDWVRKERKRYPGASTKGPKPMLAVIGDYVFLPYPHMFEDALYGKCLPLSEFTTEYVVSLVTRRPLSWFEQEIVSYQKEIVPNFLKHLRTQMPDMFVAILASGSEHVRKKCAAISDVGRSALLKTLAPNVGKVEAVSGGTKWAWDGESLKIAGGNFSWPKSIDISLTPADDCVVKVTDDQQVLPNTKFID